ncbi:PREDICTED: xanthine dehydrogenase/oxidase-like, partial [Priapulus caudatus]|uniref:xanthine dehydrogenase n=1 Tax=Priapulus caudatus TaxID=37621 RepID=A0ABM1EYL6_PRICU
RLTGSKLGCGEGGCGACTVMLSRYDRTKDRIEHYSVNACLTPVCAVHGMAVTTVEGIGSTKTRLHPVQERIAKAHGSQCGFCTPGIVMSMYALLRSNPRPAMFDLENTFQGNLCRCTGYRPILEGYRSFTTTDTQLSGCCVATETGGKCCMQASEDAQQTDADDELGLQTPNSCENGCDGPRTNVGSAVNKCDTDVAEGQANPRKQPDARLFSMSDFKPYDPTQEPIFPAELQLSDDLDKELLMFKGDQVTWYRPVCLQQLLQLKHEHPDGKIVVGNTEVGVETKFKGCVYPVLISAAYVAELTAVRHTDDGIVFGASTTLTRVKEELATASDNLPAYKTRVFRAVLEMLHQFAGCQIRNVGCIGGNIMTASPISDLNQVWQAADCYVEVTSLQGGKRRIEVDDKFFPGYRRTALEKHEILLSILVPYTKQNEYFHAFKQAKRRDDDIAIVNAAMRVEFQQASSIIKDIALSFGGMAPTTVMPSKAASLLVGRSWEADMMDDVMKLLADDLPMDPGVPGGMVEYRRSLALGFFFKFFIMVNQALENTEGKISSGSEIMTATLHRGQFKSSQLYEVPTMDQSISDPVGRPMVHQSALMQATGELRYIDDIPKYTDELYLGLVLSSKTHATIVSVDESQAMKIPGVVAFVDHRDVPGSNKTGSIMIDEEIFASREKVAARALGVPANRIVCKVKRMGGAFGGKETRAILVTNTCAVAAHKVNRPVRIMLDRDEDMLMTGGRHPVLAKYKVGFTDAGKILALDCTVYLNGGCSADHSILILQKMLLNLDNCYKIANMRVEGFVCRTNLPSNTAFRGFGAPQGIMVMEVCITQVADTLGIPPEQVREKNFYKEGDLTHYKLPMENITVTRCWQECQTKSDLQQRIDAVKTFNGQHRWRKRGISMISAKLGIAFTNKFCNQGGALVLIYTDGSVLISHGGTEMGQTNFVSDIGLQVASRCLDIPTDRIFISETATDKVPNTSATAGSFSSDLNGMAIMRACEILLHRLKPYKEAKPNGCWDDWVSMAYLDRVSLTASGFYAPDVKGMDWGKGEGQPFLYYTYGVACTEVEIDCLTGDHQVLRADIVVDVGKSLNPAIDIGQIEGAFMQGYGLVTLEELRYSPEGLMYTRGPGMYKIPGFTDIPAEFNVSLLRDSPSPNYKAVYSSKAIGEPPLLLASSVFFAIKNAIASARMDAKLAGHFRLDSPATSERIRMSCVDEFTRMFPPAEPGSFKPWEVRP